jgi:hypothetical protein
MSIFLSILRLRRSYFLVLPILGLVFLLHPKTASHAYNLLHFHVKPTPQDQTPGPSAAILHASPAHILLGSSVARFSIHSPNKEYQLLLTPCGDLTLQSHRAPTAHDPSSWSTIWHTDTGAACVDGRENTTVATLSPEGKLGLVVQPHGNFEGELVWHSHLLRGCTTEATKGAGIYITNTGSLCLRDGEDKVYRRIYGSDHLGQTDESSRKRMAVSISGPYATNAKVCANHVKSLVHAHPDIHFDFFVYTYTRPDIDAHDLTAAIRECYGAHLAGLIIASRKTEGVVMSETSVVVDGTPATDEVTPKDAEPAMAAGTHRTDCTPKMRV